MAIERGQRHRQDLQGRTGCTCDRCVFFCCILELQWGLEICTGDCVRLSRASLEFGKTDPCRFESIYFGVWNLMIRNYFVTRWIRHTTGFVLGRSYKVWRGTFCLRAVFFCFDPFAVLLVMCRRMRKIFVSSIRCASVVKSAGVRGTVAHAL